jgi:excinuclease UvrABC nuclease subunit
MPIDPGSPTTAFTQIGIGFAPSQSGVYAICNGQGQYIYFGESNDIQRRLAEHLADANHAMHQNGAAFFCWEVNVTAAGRVARQNALIAAYATPCNQRMG